jgi:hypothetical protein
MPRPGIRLPYGAGLSHEQQATATTRLDSSRLDRNGLVVIASKYAGAGLQSPLRNMHAWQRGTAG